MKKNNYSFVFILLVVLMSMIGSETFAQDIQVENADGKIIYYKYSNDGKELVVTRGDKDYSGKIVIPEEVTYMNRTRKVTSIGDKAFYEDMDLYSLVIPNTVTSIGDEAFYYCTHLTSLTIPNGVTSIGKDAFHR